MEYNLVKVGFTLSTLLIVFLGGLINNFEHKLPVIIRQAYRYGKFSYKGHPSIVRTLEIPKSFYRHFYVFGSIWGTAAFVVAIYIYFFNGENVYIMRVLLDFIGGCHRKTSVSSVSTLLALTLFTVHLYRRLYETLYVSVFSNSRMNVTHYVMGLLHYFGCISAMVFESPGFAQLSFEHKSAVVLSDLKWTDIGGALLFIWAAYRQHNCAVILANLRKNTNGTVEHYKHMMPKGDLFEYVSSPHLLCEVVLYLSLGIILWGHTTWPYVFVWVLSNQMECALLAHWWYLSEFKDYPKSRRALIPYVL